MASQEIDTLFTELNGGEELLYQTNALHFSQGEDFSDQQENGALLTLPLDADKRTLGIHHGSLLASQDEANGVVGRTTEQLREIASEQYRYNLVGLSGTYAIVELVSYCAGYREGYNANVQARQNQEAA